MTIHRGWLFFSLGTMEHLWWSLIVLKTERRYNIDDLEGFVIAGYEWSEEDETSD
jgi:hypothetical protein